MTAPIASTRYIILPVIGEQKTMIGPLIWGKLKPLLQEHIGEAPEHVAVLYKGERHDMFVGEDSANGTKVRNMRATEIYRNNTLTREPGTDPESLPACYGIAVLFPDEIVWK